MTMQSERLLLRPWQPDDAEELFRYASDPRVGPAAGWPPHTDAENSRMLIQNVLSAPETYAVVLKETVKPIGSVGIHMDRHEAAEGNEVEIGYWLGVPYWGQGLIPEAVKLLLQRCFTELGCTRVWCGYYEGNEKSLRVQQKCGFTYHHTEENKPVPLLGEVRTEHYSVLTREIWQAQKDRS